MSQATDLVLTPMDSDVAQDPTPGIVTTSVLVSTEPGVVLAHTYDDADFRIALATRWEDAALYYYHRSSYREPYGSALSRLMSLWYGILQDRIPEQYKRGMHLLAEGAGSDGEDVYVVDGRLVTATDHIHIACNKKAVVPREDGLLYCGYCDDIAEDNVYNLVGEDADEVYDYEALRPEIRRTVKWLHQHKFMTMMDLVGSKPPENARDTLVLVGVLNATTLVEETHRLYDLLKDLRLIHGWRKDGVMIQAIYDPCRNIRGGFGGPYCAIEVRGLHDGLLPPETNPLV